MHTTELGSVIPDTGTEHAPANDSGSEQAPATGTPPPGSTTHHFTTQEGNEAYRAQARLDLDSVRNPHIEGRYTTASQAWDPDNEVDQSEPHGAGGERRQQGA